MTSKFGWLQAPATNLKFHNINYLKLFAGDLQICDPLLLRSHLPTAALHLLLV